MHMVRTGSALTSRRQCVIRSALSTAMIAVLAVSVGMGGAAHADELEDRKVSLEAEIAKVQESIEYLDADIVKTIAQLRVYQGELPAAQQALAEAQGRVVEATDEVNALALRMDLATETKGKITEQLDQDKAEMTEAKKVIGQIATQAYKNGGVPSSLSLIFGAEGADSLSSSVDLADQALRSQGAAVDRLSQRSATNVNSQARLASVEEEIRDLKDQADAALAREQGARDAAAAQKERVDKLVADTSALSERLQARKPAIEAKLAKVEAARTQVQEDIAERQQRLLEEARRQEEQRRAAAEAQRQREIAAAAAAAAAANRPAPPPPPAIAAVKRGTPSDFGLRYPVEAPVTSGFGTRSTPLGTIDFAGTGEYEHTGIDFAPPCETEVHAPASGEVWYADQGGGVMIGTGNRLVLNHGVVKGNTLATNYYHLSRFVVFPGQHVSAGQLIGYVGSTGNSTGCHLHFETMLNGELVDPADLL